MLNIHDILRRIKVNWRLKISFTIAINIMFWLIYFTLQRLSANHATLLKPSFLDHLIPFWPNTIYLYWSLWLLSPIGPWLMTSREEFKLYCEALITLLIIGFTVFIIYPTACPRPAEPYNTTYLYHLTVAFDKRLNAFPSFHAAFAIYSSLCCNYMFKKLNIGYFYRAIIVIWTAFLLFSTLTTKQHLLLDITGGSLLGLLGYHIFNIWAKRIQLEQDRVIS
jgi:membrane-associated phospholipid phosphatase